MGHLTVVSATHATPATEATGGGGGGGAEAAEGVGILPVPPPPPPPTDNGEGENVEHLRPDLVAAVVQGGDGLGLQEPHDARGGPFVRPKKT